MKTINYTGNSKLIARIVHLLNRKAPLPLDGQGDAEWGTSGQVLTTDGQGNTSWTDKGGGGGGDVTDVEVNGTSVVNAQGVAEVSVPTKTSDLTNDSNFITNLVNNLANYYTKSQTYTQAEVDALISGIVTLNILVVQTLPTQDISTTTIYLVPKQDTGTSDIYDEYLYINNAWELIGTTQIDLSNYVTTTDLSTALADYVTSVGLATILADYVQSADLAAVATSGSYNDLSNKPTIPAAQVNSDWNAVSGVEQILNKPTLATVATSGSYNDLTNKPTIPTVNDGTLTIQQNGTTLGTFTANQSGNTTVNLTGGGSSGHTIWNRIKTALTSRVALWFADASVSDASADGATKVEVVSELQSESDFDNLATDGTADGVYCFPNSGEEYLTADMVGYDGTSSGLSATNAQDAIDEAHETSIKRGDWWYSTDAHDADDLVGEAVFAYSPSTSSHTHTATTGTLVSMCGKDTNCENYRIQMQADYSSNKFLFRSRNGDNGTWNSWKLMAVSDDLVPIVHNNSDIPEGAANLKNAATAHRVTAYRNGLVIPDQMDGMADGGILRVRGTSESNTIFEMGTWDDSGSGETIQFNYYPTSSQVTPTYSVSVPKKSGTIALTSDVQNCLHMTRSYRVNITCGTSSNGGWYFGDLDISSDIATAMSGYTYGYVKILGLYSNSTAIMSAYLSPYKHIRVIAPLSCTIQVDYAIVMWNT